MKKYYDSVIRSLRDNGKEMLKINQEIYKLTSEINAKKYDPAYVRNVLMPKISEMQHHVRQMKNESLETVYRLTDEKRAEIYGASEIRGGELTDDARLFSCGIDLTEQDIRQIVKRNAGNQTMINLAAKYASQHNLKTYELFEQVQHREELESCDAINGIAKVYCERWIDQDEGCKLLDRFFDLPEGTANSL